MGQQQGKMAPEDGANGGAATACLQPSHHSPNSEAYRVELNNIEEEKSGDDQGSSEACENPTAPGTSKQASSPRPPGAGGEEAEREQTCHSATRVRRLFRRHSSIKVCPEDATQDSPVEAGELIESNSPSPMDSNKNSVLLFSGTLCPIALGDSTEVDEGFISPMQLYNSMNDGQLSPYIFDPTFMLIIDTRAQLDYQKLHISTAYHVSELSNPNILEPLDTYTLIVLYDYKGLSHSLTESALSQTLAALHSEGIEPFLLAGGFDTFHSKYPYLCTSKMQVTGHERQSLINNYPSIVIEDQLYLGRGDQAANNTVVRNLGITHIINVTKDHPNAFPKDLQYCRVELDDENTANLLREFPALIHFINDAVSQGGRVLVHCNLGRSRSSTVVIAYLMYSKRCSLRDAHHYLKERRPVIHPNKGFLSQLGRFEEILFGRRLTDPELIYGTSRAADKC